MSKSISKKILNSMFYEVYVTYIGSKNKDSHNQGIVTQQYDFLVILSIDRKNRYF